MIYKNILDFRKYKTRVIKIEETRL